MDPNKAFRMKRRMNPKKKCKYCGRIWYQDVRMCSCGNMTRWTGAKQQGFDVWECMECGNKRNLVDGWRWLRQNRKCNNCGHPDPGYEMVSMPPRPTSKVRVLRRG